MFVEWAPPRDSPRIFDLVFSEIPDLDRQVCAWYEVDGQYQDELSLHSRLTFLEFVAKNVGVRRARGRFVLSTNCDVFLGRHVIEIMASGELKPAIVYRAPRYDITLGTDTSRLDWNVLEDPAILDGPPKVLKPPFMDGATGDFILLDRETFHELRGFNEIYRAARFGVDRNFLVKAMSAGLPIEDIGGPVYHMTHEGSYRTSVDTYAGREQDAHWGNTRWHSRGVIYSNPETWGLGDAPTRAESPHRSFLDFSWSAVPPLVDLKRVVLPVARLGKPLPGRYVGSR